MIDATKLKEYELLLEGNARIETALGELDTVIYTSKRVGTSDRLTRTWVAPALGYLPVKAESIRGKKVEVRLLIQTVEKIGAGPGNRENSRAALEMVIHSARVFPVSRPGTS